MHLPSGHALTNTYQFVISFFRIFSLFRIMATSYDSTKTDQKDMYR